MVRHLEYQLLGRNVSLKIYMMFKAIPNKLMNIEESIDDINNASKYFSTLDCQSSAFPISIEPAKKTDFARL